MILSQFQSPYQKIKITITDATLKSLISYQFTRAQNKHRIRDPWWEVGT